MSTLTLEEAAAHVKIGLKAFKELFDSGEIPGVRMNQKHAVFHVEQLDEWIKRTAERQAKARREPMLVPAGMKVVGRRRRKPDLDAFVLRATP